MLWAREMMLRKSHELISNYARIHELGSLVVKSNLRSNLISTKRSSTSIYTSTFTIRLGANDRFYWKTSTHLVQPNSNANTSDSKPADTFIFSSSSSSSSLRISESFFHDKALGPRPYARIDFHQFACFSPSGESASPSFICTMYLMPSY